MQLNASMNNTVAERFNVSGALVVKLFGSHDRERDLFAGRGGARPRHRHHDRDVLARPLRRPRLRRRGRHRGRVLRRRQPRHRGRDLTIGTVAAFVIYVGQIYQPLTQLTNARVDVMTALVSFERVFEVLDFPPLIAERPGRRRPPVAPRAGSSSTTCGSATRRPRCRRSRRSRRARSSPTRTSSAWILRDVSLRRRARRARGARRTVGRGQDDHRAARAARPRRRRRPVLVDGHDVRDLTLDVAARRGRHGDAGPAPLPRDDRATTSATPGPTPPTTTSWPPARPPASTT